MAEKIECTLSGLRVAGKLLEAHEAYVGLVGQAGLDRIVEEWRPLFDAVRRKQHWTVLETGAEFLKKLQDADAYGSGPQQLQLCAVIYELMQRG